MLSSRHSNTRSPSRESALAQQVRETVRALVEFCVRVRAGVVDDRNALAACADEIRQQQRVGRVVALARGTSLTSDQDASRTYSKSPGLPPTPLTGGAIHDANSPTV